MMMLPVIWKVEEAFSFLKVIKTVLGPRLTQNYNLPDQDQHRLCTRLLNLLVNLKAEVTLETVEEVWRNVEEALGLIKQMDEAWVADASNIVLLREAVTFLKAAWSPDLNAKRS